MDVVNKYAASERCLVWISDRSVKAFIYFNAFWYYLLTLLISSESDPWKLDVKS